MSDPRGFRNNNPGNIRLSKQLWQGEVPSQDKAFKRFESLELGVRAAALLVLNYQRLYKLDTVEKIINRWAPPNENDTAAYVAGVARACGVTPNEKIEVSRHLVPMMKSIFRHENGRRLDGTDWVSQEALERGCFMAVNR